MTSSKSNNSFKQLQEEEEEKYQNPPKEIKENLDENFSFIKMVGQIMELYLPKVFEMIVNLTGGSAEELSRNSNESSLYDTDDASLGNSKTDQTTTEANNEGD